MNFSDINKRFTEIVVEWLSKGYTINATTMSGSQGEIAKVDLTDGKTIVRILVDSWNTWEDKSFDGVGIYVGLTDEVVPNKERADTLWTNRLNIVRSELFYKIGEDRKNGTYYGSREEAEAACDLRTKRYAYKYSRDKAKVFPAPAMAVAKKIVREKLGFKRISETEVKLSKYKNTYTVTYRGKSYHLR